MNKVKQFLNNFNWDKRERSIQYIEDHYEWVINMPLATNNKIPVESFEIFKQKHNSLVDDVLDTYGDRWKNYLHQYRFHT